MSAVLDVALDLGIPELVKGRRPVVPPLARLGRITGNVSVRFSIDSGGSSQVLAVEGPELLQLAAREMVASWTFRRLRPDRVMARAEVEYGETGAQARVSLER
jgi:outer membrane biosynthesis protein TonB